jgi:hypothetical protein
MSDEKAFEEAHEQVEESKIRLQLAALAFAQARVSEATGFLAAEAEKALEEAARTLVRKERMVDHLLREKEHEKRDDGNDAPIPSQKKPPEDPPAGRPKPVKRFKTVNVEPDDNPQVMAVFG